MIDQLPSWVHTAFIAVVILTIAMFYRAVKNRKILLTIAAVVVVQSVIGLSGFYNNFTSLPPRILLGMLPSIILILYAGFFMKQSTGNTNFKYLTQFHTIRIPVEVMLSILFHYSIISRWQTIEGSNFDIISGLTALPVAYFGYTKKSLSKPFLIGWNVLCLLLLFNVVITSAFAMPYPFQLISHQQPNIAIAYFPFNLLPTVIVPLVILSHIMLIRNLTNREK